MLMNLCKIEFDACVVASKTVAALLYVICSGAPTIIHLRFTNKRTATFRKHFSWCRSISLALSTSF